MRKLTFLVLATCLASCLSGISDDDKAISAATQWGEAYFNCDYHAAAQSSTPESHRWLQFAASNTTQQDLDLQKETPADVEADEFFPDASDTLRVVMLKVRHYLKATPLGLPSQQEDKGLFRVVVVKRDGRWLVRMEGLPRSERQSHD